MGPITGRPSPFGRAPARVRRAMAPLSYRDAGVDIDAGHRLVDRIKSLAASTRTPEVLGGVGGFAGLMRLPEGLKEPILVAGTDGVGTKLKVAFDVGRHDSIGIDLVAMSVNDVITVGATPLFFLDYFATSQLDVDQAEDVVRGIAEGCRLSGCALLGGETAELPGFYRAREYDLAGFCVGVVDKNAILDGSNVQDGDSVIGIASSGLHSNGYSLARKALLEVGRHRLDARDDELGTSLGDALLLDLRESTWLQRRARSRPDRCTLSATSPAAESPRISRACCRITWLLVSIRGRYPDLSSSTASSKREKSTKTRCAAPSIWASASWSSFRAHRPIKP